MAVFERTPPTLPRVRELSVSQADAECAASKARRFAVTTISWTSTVSEPVVDGRRHKVHRTVYEWTLPFLIRWIRESTDAHEEIIQIEPVTFAGAWVEALFPPRHEAAPTGSPPVPERVGRPSITAEFFAQVETWLREDPNL